MKLDFNLQVTQKQGIALTAQVQQAIKLLHMTNMEIQEYVDDQFQDNPFIETAGEFGEQQQAEQKPEQRVEQREEAPSPRRGQETSQEKRGSPAPKEQHDDVARQHS